MYSEKPYHQNRADNIFFHLSRSSKRLSIFENHIDNNSPGINIRQSSFHQQIITYIKEDAFYIAYCQIRISGEENITNPICIRIHIRFAG